MKLCSHSKSFIDLVHLPCKFIRTDAATCYVFVQQAANREPGLGWRSQVTHHAVRKKDPQGESYQQGKNSLQAHSSIFRNSEQYTKQLNNTLDIHGQHVSLSEFLYLPLTWKTEDSGFDFSRLWDIYYIQFFYFNSSFSLAWILLGDLSQSKDL